MRFIHLADCHLGYYQYGIKERAEDFMNNFISIMKGKTDFFLISGDFFHQRQVDPNTVHLSLRALGIPKESKIPVYVIPGNHDKSLKGGMSWLQYLGKTGYIKLIENGYEDYNKKIRIFGFNTYNDFLSYIEENGKLETLDYNIMMLHEAMDGYLPSEGMTMEEVQVIRDQGIDYLALGHIHSPYDIGGWIYNPGSLERTSISDSVGGAYLTEVGKETKLKKYSVRPVYKMTIDVTNKTDEEIKKEIKDRSGDWKKEGLLSLKFEGKVERIFNAKGFAPEMFHVLVSNETSFNSGPIDIKEADNIESEVIRQMTENRKDVRKLIFGMMDSDNLSKEEIMDIINKSELDEVKIK